MQRVNVHIKLKFKYLNIYRTKWKGKNYGNICLLSGGVKEIFHSKLEEY